MRIVLEVGLSYVIFAKITPADLTALEHIVEQGEKLGIRYNCEFHKKLHEISGNRAIIEFQQVISPAIEYVLQQNKALFDAREKELAAKGKLITDRDLFELLKSGNEPGYREAIVHYFDTFSDYFGYTKSDAEDMIRSMISSKMQ